MTASSFQYDWENVSNFIESLMQSFEYTDALMLLGDQLNSTKSQNTTSTGETAGDNADNLWFPILHSYWNLIRLKDTRVCWE